GSSPLNVAVDPAFPPTVGPQFRIIDNQGAAAVSGTFAGLPQGATLFAGGSAFVVSYTGGTGNDVVLTTTAVPEPTAAAALGLAALGLLARRRGRRRA
ncbi:MAG TPA: PEP-CTERM sorting domain-containing protein, partial [Humisphaera sp.]